MAIGVRDLSPDTIAAIATPSGRSALAIVRISGPDVQGLGARLLDPWPIADRQPTLCVLRAVDGSVIDRPLATLFHGPASFTGEDVLEISTHGGILVPSLALRACLNAGAREALPGEFTRRAVLNGKLDILQAEAIGDLIDARTEALHHAAVTQLDGALSRVILDLRNQLIELEALISYDIDFPEEDDGPVPREKVIEASRRTADTLRTLADTAPVGELIREGAITVIAGRPNAGKSSLFNALIGQARAIVTDVPGTTRDAIEAVINVEGWPVRLIDTAGLRSASDVVERLGVEVSERYLAGAHLVLLCADNVSEIAALRQRLRELSKAPIIVVLTKADLVTDREQSPDGIPVSATARTGLRDLLVRIRGVLAAEYGAVLAEKPLVTRARHLKALQLALAELQTFDAAWRHNVLPAPVAAVHLRSARSALEELVGAVDVDDVLDQLFRTFCIGK